jgi:hypothetical protein
VRRLNDDVTLWTAVLAGTLIWFAQKPAAEKALAEIVHPSHSRIIVRAPIPPIVDVQAEIEKARLAQSHVHFVQAEVARKQSELCKKRAQELSNEQFNPTESL